jgi:hypothetical protein
VNITSQKTIQWTTTQNCYSKFVKRPSICVCKREKNHFSTAILPKTTTVTLISMNNQFESNILILILKDPHYILRSLSANLQNEMSELEQKIACITDGVVAYQEAENGYT